MRMRKNKKWKRNNEEKRLIAERVAVISLITLTISLCTAVIPVATYQANVRKLDKNKDLIYKQFMETGEFSDYVDKELIKITEEYTTNGMTYGKFRKRLNKIYSLESAKEVLETSNNNSFTAQLEEIDAKKEKYLDKYSSSIAKDVGVAGVAVSGATAVSATATAVGYAIKESLDKNDKSKTKIDKSMSAQVIHR